MVRCTICGAVTNEGRRGALDAGWRLMELSAGGGMKYLCACPEHDVAAIVDALRGALKALGGGPIKALTHLVSADAPKAAKR